MKGLQSAIMKMGKPSISRRLYIVAFLCCCENNAQPALEHTLAYIPVFYFSQWALEYASFYIDPRKLQEHINACQLEHPVKTLSLSQNFSLCNSNDNRSPHRYRTKQARRC